jgi:hypothetical protein
MSARENITKNIHDQLLNMTEPAPGLVSREFFEVSKIAITQFPAILINTLSESRSDISTDLREGIMSIQLKCYVRGTQIDTLRNDIVERVEEILEVSRDRDLTRDAGNIHAVSTRISNIEVVERELPLGEVVITVEVRYQYLKGVL